MNSPIPSASDVRKLLSPRKQGELEELALKSNIPLTTLDKIKKGVTKNPGIDTVRKFYKHLLPSKAKQPTSA